jgi:hypothetical protein
MSTLYHNLRRPAMNMRSMLFALIVLYVAFAYLMG